MPSFKRFLYDNPLQAAFLAAVALLLLAMYWDVGRTFVPRWIGDPEWYHCLAIPFIAAWLLWRRRPALEQVVASPWWGGFLLLAFALLLYLAGVRTGIRMVTGLAFPFLLAGVVGALYGRRVLLISALPLAVLFFAIPFPKHATAALAMPMQEVSAALAGLAAPLLGLAVIRQGITLNLEGFNFVVAEECSGMRSLVALLVTGLVLIELFGLTGTRRLLAFLAIPPVVLFANVIRLLVVLLTAQYFGAEFALGTVTHGLSDIIVYVTAVLSFFLLLGWLQETPSLWPLHRETSPPPEAEPLPQHSPAGGSE